MFRKRTNIAVAVNFLKKLFFLYAIAGVVFGVFRCFTTEVNARVFALGFVALVVIRMLFVQKSIKKNREDIDLLVKENYGYLSGTDKTFISEMWAGDVIRAATAIAEGGDVNCANCDLVNALNIAVCYDDIELVMLVLKNDFDPNVAQKVWKYWNIVLPSTSIREINIEPSPEILALIADYVKDTHLIGDCRRDEIG